MTSTSKIKSNMLGEFSLTYIFGVRKKNLIKARFAYIFLAFVQVFGLFSFYKKFTKGELQL